MNSGKESAILLGLNYTSMNLKPKILVLESSPTSGFWLTRLIAGQDKHNNTNPVPQGFSPGFAFKEYELFNKFDILRLCHRDRMVLTKLDGNPLSPFAIRPG